MKMRERTDSGGGGGRVGGVIGVLIGLIRLFDRLC